MTSDALDILVKQLNDGLTDLAFVTHVDKNYLIGLESKTIMKSPLLAVMHPTHALANRDSLSIKRSVRVPNDQFLTSGESDHQ